MKGKKYKLSVLLFFFCIPGLLPADDLIKTQADRSFEQLLQKHLDQNIQYRQARLERAKAELALNQLKNFAIPYLTLEGGKNGIVYTEGELQPLELQGSLRWTNVLGAEISIGSPFSLDQEKNISSINLAISRQLFPENDVRELRARAALQRSIETEMDAEYSVLYKLLDDIFTAYLETERFALSRQNLELLEQELTAAVSADSQRSLQQKILRARRQLLQAEQSILNMDPFIKSQAALLRNQAIEAANARLLELPEFSGIHTRRPDSSLQLSAHEYTLAAAQLEGRRVMLAYFPNPRIALDWQYHIPDQRTQWSLSLQFSLDLLDRGERAMEALRRREQPEIERLRLLEAEKRHQEEFREVLTRYELLEYDIKLQEYTLEDTFEEEARAERMYTAGFINAETYKLAVLDRQNAELAMQELEQNALLRKLEILALYKKTGAHDE